MAENKILVVDFGAQYAHLIARRVRELGVYSEIALPDAPVSEFRKAKGIILSGGPASVLDSDSPKVNKKIFELGVPVLGLCYGHQLMAQLLGGKVERGKVREYGSAKLEVLDKKGIFKGLGKKENIWMSHGDTVTGLPSGFGAAGSTMDCRIAAMADHKNRFYGLQFHPEVTHTAHGMKILSNFVFGICGCKKNWSMRNFMRKKIAEIKKEAGKKKVFMLASGGVDSTVALALLSRAIGRERIYALHIDMGFMRKNESDMVAKALEKLGMGNMHVVDASEEFFGALKNVSDPEEKREIIGSLFIEMQKREMGRMNLNAGDWLLGQGTIYPDTIETAGTKHAAKIKTHHNRVPVIKEMIEKGKIIEPLKELYKDEVRKLGEILGLPKAIVWRHPFPGPGLAIRCLCTPGGKWDVYEINAAAGRIAAEFGFSATVLQIRSVGVQGDERSYAHPCVLQGRLDWKKLEEASTKITNEIRGINRCIYAVQPQAISSAEVVDAFLTRERIERLREADAIVMDKISDAGLMKEIWQFPTVLIPVRVNGSGESIVLRPVESREAMTARFYRMDRKTLAGITKAIMGIKGIGAVFYDVTNKPPATIEWE